MSFTFEVKYRGCIQVTGWLATHAQPRPGLIEANSCVKRIQQGAKQTKSVIISISPEEGVKCIDTSSDPAKILMSNSVFEIAHCGLDVSNPKIFTCIVGSKGPDPIFFCHIFKCDSKEITSQITRSIANCCTLAFQELQRKKSVRESTRASVRRPSMESPPQAFSQPVFSPPPTASPFNRGTSVRASTRGPMSPGVSASGAIIEPKLTDAWFRPSMSRMEVTDTLQNADIGEFIIRESQSQPGDYALSVQAGNNIWTGLVQHTENGYQLGSKATICFDELTDLVKYYAQNKFMNDSFGNALTLRLPYFIGAPQMNSFASPQSFGSPSSGFQDSFDPAWNAQTGGLQRKPTWKNPPLETAPPAPACGWPEDEENETTFSFVPGKQTDRLHAESFGDDFAASRKKSNEPDSEDDLETHGLSMADYFGMENVDAAIANKVASKPKASESEDEGDMSAPHLPAGMNMSDLDNALDALSAVHQEVSDAIGDDDDFDPRSAPAMAKAAKAAPPPAPPVDNGPAALTRLTDYVFETSKRDADGLISGVDIRPTLLKSGLDTKSLATIWMEIDEDRKGKIDKEQLHMVLALISNQQSGKPTSLADINFDTVSPPKLQGVEVPPPMVQAAAVVMPAEGVAAAPAKRGRVTF